jgi:hypothetical protein
VVVSKFFFIRREKDKFFRKIENNVEDSKRGNYEKYTTDYLKKFLE